MQCLSSISFGAFLQVSAVKAHIAEAKQGLRKVETEIMVATGVETAQPDVAPGSSTGSAAADVAAHVHFGQLMSAFHESAAANIADTEVCTSYHDIITRIFFSFALSFNKQEEQQKMPTRQ